MNSNRVRLARTALAIGAATALTLAACGGDDDSTADPTSAAPADTEPAAIEPVGPPLGPSALAASAQVTDGAAMTVDTVELPAPGFIAVHGDADGVPGPVIGHSTLLPAGSTTDVVVTFDTPLSASGTVYPMVHIDVDGNGAYDFAPPDVTTDAPGQLAGGGVAMVSTELSVSGGDDAAQATSDDTVTANAAGDDTVITIATFAFSGAAEVPVGTTVTVRNDDGVPHTWTSIDGAFDSDTLAPGESFEFTFDEPGTYAYFCAFHPQMSGTITITA